MKTRFKNKGRLQICDDYPDCNCKTHLVYEEHKRKKSKPSGDRFGNKLSGFETMFE